MRFIQRLTYRTFWYDQLLRRTFWRTLQKRKVFSSEEVARARDIFRGILRAHAEKIRDVQGEYHLSFCAAILAVYKLGIAKGMQVSQATEFTESVLFENLGTEKIAAMMKRELDRARDPFERAVASSRDQERNFFGSSFTFERPLDTRSAYTAVVHTCFYNDFFRSNGLPHLMRIACNWDLASWTKGIVPSRHGFVFSRPTTLGLDEKPCEFRFERIR